MSLAVLPRILALAAAASAFRTKPARNSRSKADRGQVDFLYTFGSPATAVPSLKNRRAKDGCFPGLRVVTVSKALLGKQMDHAPSITRPFLYAHPMMNVVELDAYTGKQAHSACSKDLTLEPTGSAKAPLHHESLYSKQMQTESDERLAAISFFGCNTSFVQEESLASEQVKEKGWRLVSSATHAGKPGPQVSHLIQNPKTLECVVTFQGSSSAQDWVSERDVVKAQYCGLPEFVHKGFRNNIRSITTSDDWQGRIRQQLPSCASVTVAGQSSGSAMSELFTACVTEAAESEDYNAVSWLKGTPRQLEYVA